MSTEFTFHKEERLCSKQAIDKLFANGRPCFSYPLKLVWLPADAITGHDYPCQILFAVPKRHFKRAVIRNRIKRRMREAYRLNKDGWYKTLRQNGTTLTLLLLYTPKEELDYSTIEKGLIKGLRKIQNEVGQVSD